VACLPFLWWRIHGFCQHPSCFEFHVTNLSEEGVRHVHLHHLASSSLQRINTPMTTLHCVTTYPFFSVCPRVTVCYFLQEFRHRAIPLGVVLTPFPECQFSLCSFSTKQMSQCFTIICLTNPMHCIQQTPSV